MLARKRSLVSWMVAWFRTKSFHVLARIDATAGRHTSQPLPVPWLARSASKLCTRPSFTISNSSWRVKAKCSHRLRFTSRPAAASSASSSSATSGTQPPQPVPALVHALTPPTVDSFPASMARRMSPLLTLLQEQICVSSEGALGHLVARADEAVDHAAGERALADAEDVGVARAELRIDHDPAAGANLEAGRARQLVARPDAGRDDDHVDDEVVAGGEAEAGDRIGAEDRLRLHPGVDVHAERRDLPPQHFAAGGVDLARHEPRGELDDVYLEAEIVDGLRRFEAEEPAADDGRAARSRAPGADRVQVLDRPVDEHAGRLHAGDRRHERRRAGCEHERVVGDAAARARDDDARRAVDLDHALAEMERDAARRVPGGVSEDERVRALAAHVRGEMHAVVRRAALLAEADDAETPVAIVRREPLAEAMSDHPVADDDDGARVVARRRDAHRVERSRRERRHRRFAPPSCVLMVAFAAFTRDRESASAVPRRCAATPRRHASRDPARARARYHRMMKARATCCRLGRHVCPVRDAMHESRASRALMCDPEAASRLLS